MDARDEEIQYVHPMYPHGQTPNSRGKVYVASSWRNEFQKAVVHILRAAGFTAYDFKDPETTKGFHWSEVGVDSTACSLKELEQGLQHPRAVEGFQSDFNAMLAADIFVLVLPCGKSAHLELGWAAGRSLTGGGRPITVILFDDSEPVVPELMYKMCDFLVGNVNDLLDVLGVED